MATKIRGTPHRAVPLTYGALAALLLVLIAAMALVFVPPSTPSIAEFAPKAEQAIEDAPFDQSSRFGSGAGGCAAGQVCETEVATPRTETSVKKAVDKARVRRCVGNPPRQTEDPQSPPCVNFWAGSDNGGATSKGVTRDEIRIATRRSCGPGCAFDEILDHFNRRYEFYGRRLSFVRFASSAHDAPAQRVAAQKVDEELRAFASTGWNSLDVSDTGPYRNELARRKIITVASYNTGVVTTEELNAHAPYQWVHTPTIDVLHRNFVEFACRSLVGKPARYAGVDLSINTRRFAVTFRRDPRFRDPDVQILVAGLQRCGSGDVKVVPVRWEDPDGTRLAMADLRLAGVTSIVAADLAPFNQMLAAQQAGYSPEWQVVGSYNQTQNGSYSTSQTSAHDQAAHLFGLHSFNKWLDNSDEPWYWAMKESNPSSTNECRVCEIYPELLILASGIQLAGPNLTPETFAAGLRNARFPNPGGGGPPYYQGSVGFGPGDHQMIDDVTLVYWEQTADSRGYANTGNFCYVERGLRYSTGRWPQRDYPFFDRTQPCR